ncbi:MAG: Cysteine-rich protein [Gemmatimonadetes bacterium]|nr:Cysteine-rich protein [Gemmatimonadota bacterium]
MEYDSEEEFDLGDGTAETEACVRCPYCGESVEIALDPGSGEQQEYVEDCEVCCQPWRVSLCYDAEGRAEVSVSILDE